MRITLFFIFLSSVFAYSANSYSQNTKLSLNLNHVTVSDVFKAIEGQSEFIFFYRDQQVDLNRVVDIVVEEKSVNEILDQLFEGTGNVYKIHDRQIIIGKSEKQLKLTGSDVEGRIFEENQQPQKKEIRGTIKDDKGLPLPGATVAVKGTTTGTISDADGNFTLSIPVDAQTISISFVGMVSQEINPGSQTNFNIVLTETAIGMEEVVVVGYGIQKKESVVGAVAQVKGELIKNNVQGGDLGTGLIGSIPGLTTIRTNGRPGGMDYGGSADVPVEMTIRGVKTWNNSAPLVLVDGVERNMQNVNPYDIENISILKDASATAVFGVKGANGVILITTLRGQEGKAQVTFDYTTTVKTLSRVAKKANSYLANNTKNWAILNEVPISESSWASIKPEEWVEYYRTHEYPEYFPDIDWANETLKNYAIDRTANLTLSGGSKFVKYHSAISYLHESDLIDSGDIGQGYNPSFRFDRINLRSNLDFTITPTTQFSANLSGSFYNQKKPGTSMYGYKGFWGMAPDIWPVQYRDGTYGENVGVINAEPVPMYFNYMGYDRFKGVEINTDFILTQKLDFILKGLSAKAKLSYDNTSRTQGSSVNAQLPMTKFISPRIVDDPEFTPGMTDPELAALEYKYTTWNVGAASSGYDWSMPENTWEMESVNLNVFRNLFYEFSFNYKRDFKKHALTALTLVSRQIRASGSEFASFREDWVGRVTYAYDRKYLFEANAAYNGSEKFSKKYRFGFFPSVAAGWIVSNENFFEPLTPVINTFKLRYSDGIVGSDAGIARWLYTSSYIVHPQGGGGETVRYFGAPYPQPSYPMRYRGVIPNEEIHWETSHKQNIGVETGFFKNMLKINFDYFQEKRRDVFVGSSARIIPDYFGAPAVSANLGKVDVHGWELEVDFTKTTAKGFTFWFSNAWTFAKDKIIKKSDPELKPSYQKTEGYQINQPRVILNQSPTSVMNSWNDVYLTVGGENNAQVLPGDFMRIDFNNDGVINADDEAPYGFPSRPQFTYAPAAGISFKNLSANVRFYGVYNIEGSTLYEQQSFAQSQSGGEAVVIEDILTRAWSPEFNMGANSKFTGIRYRTSPSGGYFAQSRSYLRLETAEIAYSLNSKSVPWLKLMRLSNLKIKLSGNNLFLISKMLTDKDTEGDANNPIYNYPVLKRYNLGISIDF